MNRSFLKLAAVAAFALSSGVASAQMTGGTGPAPGSGNSTAVAAGAREDQAEVNRVVSRSDRRKAARAARQNAAVAATAADIVAGTKLNDSKGEPIGTVETVEADGAVVASGTTRIKVPLESFGKNKNGLLLGITKAEFDALVANATTKPQG
jgi:hypothetical protein